MADTVIRSMAIETSRCSCCGARAFIPTNRILRTLEDEVLQFTHGCSYCGLLVHDDPCMTDTIREQIADAVHQTQFELPARWRGERRWGLDIYTLRTAATRYFRRTKPSNETQRDALGSPHGQFVAQAHFDDLSAADPGDVEIALLCRPSELDHCLHRADAWLKLRLDVLIVVDAEAIRSPDLILQRQSGESSLRIMRRPLAGDFAAQRNFAQSHAGRSWTLQLDADETPEEPLLRSLGGLVAMADRDKILSIGFARRNLVDGVLSDVYPDVQYRLNRASVRFGGKVHERPILAGGWRQSFIALTGEIDHHLSADHVAERSHRYEALAPGEGRLDEARRLMEPYRP